MSTEHTVIFGGSSGIGLATAKFLLENSHKVTIIGRSQERLENAKNSLSGDVNTLQADAQQTDDLKSVFDQIGSFDNLVLALGSTKGAGAFSEIDLNEVKQGFEEKVFPHFAVAQAALQAIRKNGTITFISAVTAHSAMPGTAGIGSANAAISALVPILAAELKPLRVNGVAPGVIDTPWWDFLPDEQKKPIFDDYASNTPVGRVGHSDDVALAISLLINNTFITGQILTVDGGLGLGS